VAEITISVDEIDAVLKQRLAAALSHKTGKQVSVKVIVDSSILGGIVARVGDTVIDGTVRSRLDQVKSLL